MLQFSNFRKLYGAIEVLRVPDLKLTSGIYWIKGANGSGKSTLLKASAGIIDFEGDIILEPGISLKKNPTEFRRAVNFAEAEPVFPGFLSGLEMIRLFTSAKQGKPEQHRYYTESMGMTEWVGEPVGTYSSGMLKKLSIVLAFLGQPKLILLDEPLITIDAASLKILYRWIVEHHTNLGINFLLSSHQPLELENTEVKILEVREQNAFHSVLKP